MKKAGWSVSILMLGLLAALLRTPAGGLAHSERLGSDPVKMASPVLDPLFDIQVDGVDNTSPAVAYNSRRGEHLVVWTTEQDANTWDIWARRVGAGGSLGAVFNVATGSSEQRTGPDVAYSSARDEYLVVYVYEASPNDYDIYAQRVSWSGGLVSGEFAINTDLAWQTSPTIAYNSGNDEYLVVYQNTWADFRKDIAAQRVRASDGALESWRNIASDAGQWRIMPDVVYNEHQNEYLIMYTHYDASSRSARAKRSSHDMATLYGETTICGSPSYVGVPMVSAGSGEYLAIWISGVSGTFDSVFARRVDGEGNPQGSSNGFEIGATGSILKIVDPTVAYGEGYGHLVTWEVSTSSGCDVYGRYVMAGEDSAVGNAFAIFDTANSSQGSPAPACAAGGNCLVATADNWVAGGTGDTEIRGRFVRPHRVHLPLVTRNLT